MVFVIVTVGLAIGFRQAKIKDDWGSFTGWTFTALLMAGIWMGLAPLFLQSKSDVVAPLASVDGKYVRISDGGGVLTYYTNEKGFHRAGNVDTDYVSIVTDDDPRMVRRCWDVDTVPAWVAWPLEYHEGDVECSLKDWKTDPVFYVPANGVAQ